MNCADPMWTRQWIVLSVAKAADDFGLLQYLPCVPDDRLPNWGDVYTAVRPLEKDRTELLFKLVNLPRKRWLTDETASGSLAEMQGFTYGDEIFKITKIHL